MMKKLSLVGAAVAAVLGTGPAFALDPSVVNDANAAVKLTVSGSSAFEAAFESELSGAGSSICQSGSYNKFVASVTGGGTAPDLRAYTCNSTINLFGGVSKTMLITYRGEGGSVYGYTPLVRAGAGTNKVLRLVVTAGCQFNALGATAANNCTVGTSYTGATDTLVGGTANAVDANSDMGLADEEPAQFKTPNYPDTATGAKLQPALTDAERTALGLTAKALVLQSFGVYTHVDTASVPSAEATLLNNLSGLSREALAGIFAGKWNDWNQVPRNDGSNTAVINNAGSLPIYVCRREAGSGTQVAASIFLHNTNCGGADQFCTQASPVNLSNCHENTTSGTMRSCISGNAGAIGYISSEADATGRKQIQIDGQGTAVATVGANGALSGETANNLGVATASGDYGFAYELVAVTRSGLIGDPATLAGKLITVAQDQTKGPTTPNVSFLPITVNSANTGFPLTTPAGKQPISCETRTGNSCANLDNSCT